MPGTNVFAPDNGTVQVALTDGNGNAILAKGTAALLPSAVEGYAVGCEYIATDTGAHYYNTGTASSASFSLANAGGAYVVKFAGKPTTVGGAAAEAFTVTGAAATDLPFVQVVDNGTGNVTVLQAVVTTNTLTVTFSGNPGNDTVISYQLLRAA